MLKFCAWLVAAALVLSVMVWASERWELGKRLGEKAHRAATVARQALKEKGEPCCD